MSPFAIAALSFSMSADACAAAVARGASRRPSVGEVIRSRAVFGIIEAITPIIGWALGLVAASFITGIDHWIAFGLLAAVGGRMLFEGLRKQSAGYEVEPPVDKGIASLVVTAIGTSIDAAAVGVTFAFLDVNILVVAASIGLTTFALTTAGLLLGRALDTAFGAKVEMFGGLILIAVGTIILLEHTGHL